MRLFTSLFFLSILITSSITSNVGHSNPSINDISISDNEYLCEDITLIENLLIDGEEELKSLNLEGLGTLLEPYIIKNQCIKQLVIQNTKSHIKLVSNTIHHHIFLSSSNLILDSNY